MLTNSEYKVWRLLELGGEKVREMGRTPTRKPVEKELIIVGYLSARKVSHRRSWNLERLKGWSGFEFLMKMAACRSMRGTTAGRAYMNGPVVTLTSEELERDTDVPTIFGLEATGGTDSTTEGRDIGVM